MIAAIREAGGPRYRYAQIDPTSGSDGGQPGGNIRTRVEDGFRTYTYGEYSVKMSRDLVIRFDDKDVVKSYSFSSSYPEDENL